MASDETISVVCAVTDGDAPIEEFQKRLKAAMQAVAPRVDFEIIYVDDATTDGTYEILLELAERDAHVGVIRLSRPFGREVAIAAGVDHAEGDAIVVIEPYLQDPPEVIAELIAKWREGYETVNSACNGEPTDFRLMSRRVVSTIRSVGDSSRYSLSSLWRIGFPQFVLEYERDINRLAPAAKQRRVVSSKPLRAVTALGLVAIVFSVFYALVLVVQGSASGVSIAVLLTTLLGGIQLLALALLGSYLRRTLKQFEHRPRYVTTDSSGSTIDLTDSTIETESVRL